MEVLMHIPDGYLGPLTYGGLWAAMAPIWFYASRQIKKTLRVTQVPLLALSAAFSFVIMMFNVPIPGGTTGHATGATLIAILIRPWPAVIAASIALVIQALVFGDGGITAIGANCFNMAFAEVLVGYAIFRLIAGRQGEATSTQGTRFLTGAGVGSYVGINLAALLTAVELGIQPLLHVGADGRPLYSPFPLNVTIPAIMIEHIALFGVVEAVVTVLVLLYLRKSHPALLRRQL
jgi:cobalt/nickel transport system permease protein